MEALGLVVSEKKIFYVFPIESLWELMTPRAGSFLNPGDMVGRNYKEKHYTLLHTNYESSGPCDFGDELCYVFPMTPTGRGLYGPLEAWLAGFIKRSFIHCYTQNRKALGLVVSVKIFWCFPIVSLW